MVEGARAEGAEGGESDEALFGRYCGSGDRAAFEQLFSRYSERLYGFFIRQVSDAELSRDLVQQTFLQLHRARADFRQGSLVRPWLYTIAANLRREHFRRRGRRPEVGLDPELHPEPSVAPAATTATQRAVRRALEQLGDDQREVVVLHWYEGLSFPEIGEVVGASTTAVKVRAHRAYNKLRALLGE